MIVIRYHREWTGFREGVAGLGKHLNLYMAGSRLTTVIFNCTGPTLIILNAANNGTDDRPRCRGSLASTSWAG